MSTTDIIGTCERLENDLDFQTFCQYLIDSFKDDTFELMTESEPGASKLSAEYFAKAKVYKSLGDLPGKIRLALIEPKKKKKDDETYAR